MSKASKNAEIEKQVKRRIKKLGYGKRLVMDPIPIALKTAELLRLLITLTFKRNRMLAMVYPSPYVELKR